MQCHDQLVVLHNRKKQSMHHCVSNNQILFGLSFENYKSIFTTYLMCIHSLLLLFTFSFIYRIIPHLHQSYCYCLSTKKNLSDYERQKQTLLFISHVIKCCSRVSEVFSCILSSLLICTLPQLFVSIAGEDLAFCSSACPSFVIVCIRLYPVFLTLRGR